MSLLGANADKAAAEAQKAIAAAEPDIVLFNQTLQKINAILDAVRAGQITITIKLSP